MRLTPTRVPSPGVCPVAGLNSAGGLRTLVFVARLSKLDLTLKLDREEAAERLKAAQERLVTLRLALGGLIGGRLGPPVCILFEGWDASGKGGVIKRLVSGLDPRHVSVCEFAAPDPRERRHHFLWRFAPALPGWGGMTILDRSWYGRVLVERVERIADRDEWSRAYEEIVGFERGLASEGLLLIKFWLHISPDEQLRRFQSRAKDPLRRWKLTPEDWRNREKWDAYLEAAEEVFKRTDHPDAPWHLVPADSKRYARVFAAERVNDSIESAMRAAGIAPPPLTPL